MSSDAIDTADVPDGASDSLPSGMSPPLSMGELDELKNSLSDHKRGIMSLISANQDPELQRAEIEKSLDEMDKISSGLISSYSKLAKAVVTQLSSERLIEQTLDLFNVRSI